MIRLLGLGGNPRAGKDEIASYLVAEYGFVNFGMSDILHEILMVLDPIIGQDYDELWRYSDEVAEIGYVEAKKDKEVRRLLRVLGTEVGRDMLGSDIWIGIMRQKIFNSLLENNNRGIVVTGIRYQNELDLIHSFGHSQTWWVDRPGTEASSHSSDTSLSEVDFDFTINNNGTIEQLYGLLSYHIERAN